MRLRPALVRLHRWFGLAAALWLFLVGLTGSILVFYGELDHSLNPALFRPDGSEVTVGIDDAVRSVETGRGRVQVQSFYRGRNPTEIWTFRIIDPRNDNSPEIFFDPTSGQIRGERVWEAMVLDLPHLMPLVYCFHYSLFLGGWGEWLIGLLGFLWLLDHGVAAILAFPVPSKWRTSFRIRRVKGHKLVFDLHRAVGLWLLPVTFVLAITGTYMNWRPYAEAAIQPFSIRSAWPGSDLSALPTPLLRPRLSFREAVRVAGVTKWQGASYDASTGAYLVMAFDHGDITDDYGQRAIIVDGRTGKVLSQTHIARGTAADIIDAWQLPLHSGKALGWAGRIMICASGLALCGFVVTGLIIWNRKRRAGSRRHLRVH
jgi:uncharacterized iron-regulated membrane protein